MQTQPVRRAAVMRPQPVTAFDAPGVPPASSIPQYRAMVAHLSAAVRPGDRSSISRTMSEASPRICDEDGEVELDRPCTPPSAGRVTCAYTCPSSNGGGYGVEGAAEKMFATRPIWRGRQTTPVSPSTTMRRLSHPVDSWTVIPSLSMGLGDVRNIKPTTPAPCMEIDALMPALPIIQTTAGPTLEVMKGLWQRLESQVQLDSRASSVPLTSGNDDTAPVTSPSSISCASSISLSAPRSGLKRKRSTREHAEGDHSILVTPPGLDPNMQCACAMQAEAQGSSLFVRALKRARRDGPALLLGASATIAVLSYF